MLPEIRGREELRRSIARTIAAGELPGSLLLHGPVGVGRQRLALWIAETLLCENADQNRGGCGECRSCRLVRRLEHPDLHWFFPLPRPKGTSGPERLAEALETARTERLAERRRDPWREPMTGEPVGLYVAQVQTIRRLAQPRPSMGRQKVFIIGDAEHLVPQESSPEAANALLKLLEEPPPQTTFLVTASGPNTLLPTIHSRLLPIRVHPLSEGEIIEILVEELEIDRGTALSAARLAGGAIGRAIGFLPTGGKAGPLERVRSEARQLLEVIAERTSTGRLAAAHRISPSGARGEFTARLEALSTWIRDLGAVANGANDLIVNSDAEEFLTRTARQLPGADRRIGEALLTIEEAQDLALGNVNPQLIMAWLLKRLRQVLTG